MNVREFQDIMRPLVNKFGKISYDTRKLELIFDVVRDLPQTTLLQIVNGFIGEDIRAKLSDFKTESRRLHTQQTSSQTGHTCPWCDNKGWVVPKHLKVGSQLRPIRCECAGGVASLVGRLRTIGDNELADRVESGWKNTTSEWYYLEGHTLDE